MSSFEVVDYVPSYERKSKHAELFAELREHLDKLGNGSSVRKEMKDVKSANSLLSTARVFFKKNKIDTRYFSTMRQGVDAEGGKVYVYFGKRPGSK